jgi:hypothetical protein
MEEILYLYDEEEVLYSRILEYIPRRRHPQRNRRGKISLSRLLEKPVLDTKRYFCK